MAADPSTPSRATNGESPATRLNPWIAAGVVIAVAVGILLRFVSVSELWLDEALTVHIAEVPWGDLEPALRRDGAPPLFYALLHLWIDVFGDSNLAVRALPGLISVVTLPLAWFAGRRLGGTRIAWISLMLLVASPYAIRYATETRMYSLEILLVFAGYLTLMRALERPSIGRLAGVTIVTALLLYNQYWSPYLVAVVALGLLGTAWRGAGALRDSARNSFLAMVVGGIMFLPWAPTLLDQLAHTGTPWGDVYFPSAGFGVTATEFAGARWALGWALALPVVVLPLLGTFARPLDARHLEIDLRTVPETRWIAGTALATLGLGLTASWLSGNTYEARYGAVVFPLFILLAAKGVSVFSSDRLCVGIVAVLVVVGLAVGVSHGTEERTEADLAAAVIREGAVAGDVVVYCPDQLGPGVSRLLAGTEVEQRTFPDGDRPEFVNWVDYADRHVAADVETFAAEVLDAAGTHDIWLVSASTYSHASAPCAALAVALGTARPAIERPQIEDTEVFEHHSVTRFLS